MKDSAKAELGEKSHSFKRWKGSRLKTQNSNLKSKKKEQN